MTTQLPHERLAAEATILATHVAHFQAVGDSRRMGQYQQELTHTKLRAALAQDAAAVVAMLGLADEINETSITRTDAINYLAKVLHELQNGEKRSHYARAHAKVSKIKDAALDAEMAKREKLAKAYARVELEGDPDVEAKVAAIKVRVFDPERLEADWDPAAEAIEHLGLKDSAHQSLVRALLAGKGA